MNPTLSPTMLSVVVPTRGEESRLGPLLAALSRQTLARERWELLLAFDGVTPSLALAARLEFGGARFVFLQPRRGPGAARNLAASVATGDWLAFTEDDVTPAADWLARAAARIEAEPALDVVVGRTMKPGGVAVHRQQGRSPLYLPTNLFVKRATFTRVGGYCEDFFDAASGAYFREDTDLGFTLEEAAAAIAREDAAVVTHPEEHGGMLDPLRWARRHMMDPLLQARHPARFRAGLEVHRFGPFTVHRPIVLACKVAVAAALGALLLLALGLRPAAIAAGVIAALAWGVVWAKWRFDPRRFPVVLFVPFVMVWALAVGHWRARRLRSSRAPT